MVKESVSLVEIMKGDFLVIPLFLAGPLLPYLLADVIFEFCELK